MKAFKKLDGNKFTFRKNSLTQYFQSNKDILLDGITVRLKDRTTGETVMETTTADGGAYLFMDVLIEKLQDKSSGYSTRS